MGGTTRRLCLTSVALSCERRSMASAKRDIRHIIDSFSEDLIQIAKGVVQEHVERSLSEWQAKNQKLLLRQSAENEKALRNQKALERIERAAARRRERDEKKA